MHFQRKTPLKPLLYWYSNIDRISMGPVAHTGKTEEHPLQYSKSSDCGKIFSGLTKDLSHIASKFIMAGDISLYSTGKYNGISYELPIYNHSLVAIFPGMGYNKWHTDPLWQLDDHNQWSTYMSVLLNSLFWYVLDFH